jgi:GTP-binding protein YchF
MGLKCGIVGLPNVGKSTLFNAVSTTAKAQAANYPFCTIDPNVGVVEVPDPRLYKISEYVKPKKLVPTTFEFVDIAGLVSGASKGEGLGNQFLGHIKDCDAIAQVVRCFEDGDIVHVSGSVDPLRDIEVIDTELMLADLSTVERRLDRSRKAAKTGEKNAAQTSAFLEKIKAALESGKPARKVEGSEEDWELVRDLHLITEKPVIFIANIDEASAGSGTENKNPHYLKLKEYAKQEGIDVIPICARVEAEVAELPAEDRPAFLKDLGIEVAGLDRVIQSAYKLLGLRTYFTAGEQEVRAWTIHDGWKAPQAAGVIHTDFERGFISAEVYHYDELVKQGSAQKVKEAGALRTEGKEYVVRDGDIMLFRFNV